MSQFVSLFFVFVVYWARLADRSLNSTGVRRPTAGREKCGLTALQLLAYCAEAPYLYGDLLHFEPCCIGILLFIVTARAGNFPDYIDSILLVLRGLVRASKAKAWQVNRRGRSFRSSRSRSFRWCPARYTLYGGQRGPAKRGEVPLGPVSKRLTTGVFDFHRDHFVMAWWGQGACAESQWLCFLLSRVVKCFVRFVRFVRFGLVLSGTTWSVAWTGWARHGSTCLCLHGLGTLGDVFVRGEEFKQTCWQFGTRALSAPPNKLPSLWRMPCQAFPKVVVEASEVAIFVSWLLNIRARPACVNA